MKIIDLSKTFNALSYGPNVPQLWINEADVRTWLDWDAQFGLDLEVPIFKGVQFHTDNSVPPGNVLVVSTHNNKKCTVFVGKYEIQNPESKTPVSQDGKA